MPASCLPNLLTTPARQLWQAERRIPVRAGRLDLCDLLTTGPPCWANAAATVAPALAASFVVYPTEAVPGQPLRYAYTGPALLAAAALEVYDATGRCVHRQAAGPDGVLGVKALASGWYWVRLQSAGDSQPARFYHP